MMLCANPEWEGTFTVCDQSVKFPLEPEDPFIILQIGEPFMRVHPFQSKKAVGFFAKLVIYCYLGNLPANARGSFRSPHLSARKAHRLGFLRMDILG